MSNPVSMQSRKMRSFFWHKEACRCMTVCPFSQSWEGFVVVPRVWGHHSVHYSQPFYHSGGRPFDHSDQFVHAHYWWFDHTKSWRCGSTVLSWVALWYETLFSLCYRVELVWLCFPRGLMWCASLFWSERLMSGRGPELADKPSEERNLTDRSRGAGKSFKHTLKSSGREGMAWQNCVAVKGILPCVGCVCVVGFQTE